MKIVQVAPRYPPHTGGVETHVQEISERLVERGHEVVVLTADSASDLEPTQTRNGVLIQRHSGFAPGGAYHFSPGLVRTIRSLKADVIHAHNYHSLVVPSAVFGAGGTATVVTPHYHGASSSTLRDALLSAYRPVGRWLLQRANRVIAVSEWERERLRSDFEVEATVVPNGLNVDRFSNAEPEHRDRPYVLAVGRLEEYKGIQHVIRALPELEDIELVIAGSGAYRPVLERLADQHGVADRTTFLGFVDENRLPALYAGAEAFITLSSFEAYGMTVAESLASGTPCVVSEMCALGDWATRDDCVGVTALDPVTVANAIRRASTLSAPSRPLPTWDDVVDRLLEIYDSSSYA